MSRLAQPPGCRSCETGGNWQRALLPDDSVPFVDDLAEIHTMARNEFEWAMLLGEVATRVDRATRGTLRRHPHGSDVRMMERTQDILRLKIGPRRTAEGRRIHVRIYFTEPDTFPDLMLSLSIRAKHDDPAGTIEQNQHADESQHRCDRWHTLPRFASH